MVHRTVLKWCLEGRNQTPSRRQSNYLKLRMCTAQTLTILVPMDSYDPPLSIATKMIRSHFICNVMRFPHNCSLYVHFSQQIFLCWHQLTQKIENRQYLVNMKAVGVVVTTSSAVTFPLPRCRDPSKAHTVVLNRKSCIENVSILCMVINMNTLRT